jgi:hypothetical protein
MATRPTHYKTICISMYTAALAELDAKVEALKQRGWRKANRSMLLRLAIAELDPATVEIPRVHDAGAASAASPVAAPADAAQPTTSEPTWDPRRSRLRLRQLTSHELAIATRSPAIVGLLGMR